MVRSAWLRRHSILRSLRQPCDYTYSQPNPDRHKPHSRHRQRSISTRRDLYHRNQISLRRQGEPIRLSTSLPAQICPVL